jgi:hypothetical protein
LLALVLLDTLPVLFPTLLLFRSLLALVLLNTLPVLFPTLLLFRRLLFTLLSALTQLLGSRVLLCGTLCCRLLLLNLARLLGLAALFLLLLLSGAAGCLFSLSLFALFLILLPSFFSTTAATLRAGQIGNSQHYRQRKDSRGCEASIINFH